MAIMTYQPNTVIFREGESGDTFYQVLTGKVNTYLKYGTDQAMKISELGPGFIFGELAVIGAFPRTATIVTGESGATLMELTWDSMTEVFKANPAMIITLMQHIGRRTAALSSDCDEAHKTLSAIKAALSEPVSPSLLDKARMMVSYIFGSGRSAEGPSMEKQLETRAGKEISEGFSGYTFSCSAGTILYREKDPAACMYAIHSGSVGVYTAYGTDDQRLVTTLYPNQFFGEIGMLCGVPRTAAIVVTSDDTVLEIIKQEDLMALFEKNPSKLWMILEQLVMRLRSLTKEYSDVCEEIGKLL